VVTCFVYSLCLVCRACSLLFFIACFVLERLLDWTGSSFIMCSIYALNILRCRYCSLLPVYALCIWFALYMLMGSPCYTFGICHFFLLVSLYARFTKFCMVFFAQNAISILVSLKSFVFCLISIIREHSPFCSLLLLSCIFVVFVIS
jgi:hypothetical protein